VYGRRALLTEARFALEPDFDADVFVLPGPDALDQKGSIVEPLLHHMLVMFVVLGPAPDQELVAWHLGPAINQIEQILITCNEKHPEPR
jgi:hypothetical protein